MSSQPLRNGSRYTSILVELLRYGCDAGILAKCTPYLVQVNDNPVKDLKVTIDHAKFLDLLNHLEDPRDRLKCDKSLNDLSKVVSAILRKAKLILPEGPVQIDLVVSAAELTALPFELAKGDGGQFLCVREDREVVVTRRVRLGFAHRATPWRTKPKILLVSACPAGAGEPVPLEVNKQGLRAALRPWIEPLRGFPQAIPDERKVLKILDRATLKAIRAACDEAAAAKEPFTHVHVLAHGCPIGSGVREHFGIALHGEDGTSQPVEPEDLTEALRPIAESCAVVTLAVCHGGDQSNTILPGACIAHDLHAAGIPVVIGAQFPMTFPGSGIFVKEFYQALLQGEDVRAALHKARIALFQHRDETCHDWASLVGYVRLPEGYADHLVEVSLESDLASLRTAQCWSDHIIEHKIKAVSAFEDVAGQLRQRIGQLQTRLGQAETCGRKGVIEENRGLLGSAEKRLAEVYFHLWRAEFSEDRKRAMREALDRSQRWYATAYKQNLSHHWTGVQMLSLIAVLQGRLDTPQARFWDSALTAAQLASENDEKEYWAAGSLAELYLLAPAANRPAAMEAAAALGTLKQRTRRYAPDDFPIESTLRQLRRYTEWWTKENGFFDGNSDLADSAAALIRILTADAGSEPEAKPGV